jgi:WD40 repeat protein
VTTGEQIQCLRHTNDVRCLAFSSDGQRFVSGGHDRVLKVWDTQSWKLLHEQSDLTGEVETVAFHPKDNHVLAWGSTDATVKLWNTATEEVHTLRGHKSWVMSVTFGPDGEWLASGSLDGTIKGWRVPTLLMAPDRATGVSSD